MKELLNIIKNTLIGVGIVLAVYFFLQWRVANRDHIELQGLLNDTVNHFELVITDQGQEIAIQDQTVASLENVIAAGIITQDELRNKNLKQVDHIIKLKSQVVFLEELIAQVDTPNVVTIDSVDCPDVNPGTYLKVPANFAYTSEWVSFAGIIYGETIGLHGLSIKQESTVILGYQKTGLFKPLRPVVTIEDANPYVHTVELRNVTIRQKAPFYSRPWFHFLGGAASMVAVQILLNKTR